MTSYLRAILVVVIGLFLIGGCTVNNPEITINNHRPRPMIYCGYCGALVPLGHAHIRHYYRYGYTGPRPCGYRYYPQTWHPGDPYVRQVWRAPPVGWE